MSGWLTRANVVLLIAMMAGCAATSRNPTEQSVNRNLLSREQIVETRATNAYDVVQTLRSNWLLTRGLDSFSTPGQVLVYYNGTRLGGVETLRQITLNEIGYIEYFDGREATARWGLDHGHGVIFVATLTPR